jgi:TonB family protein
MSLILIPVYCQAPPAKPPVAPISLGIELMTDPEGVDLSSFMKHLYKSVRDRALATMPKSVALGDQGVVRISFQVQKDGTLVTASPALPKFIHSSGKETLDNHAMGAIKSAAPFDHLPEPLPARSIELKFTFYYNLPPPSL